MENELIEEVLDLSAARENEAVKAFVANYLPTVDDMKSVANELDRRFLEEMMLMQPRAPWVGIPTVDNIHSYKGFRPLSDQVLVRPLPAQDRVSSSSLIVIPGNHDRGRLDNKLGVVLALGPGDAAVPATSSSATPGGDGRWKWPHSSTGRTEFGVAVGDTILYAPRGWAEIEIDGESLILVHDCQGILAIVDPDTVLFTEDPTTKKKGPDWAK